MAAFAEVVDVLDILQEYEGTRTSGSALADRFVEPAIKGVSDWFARQTNGYWFDSGANIQTDLIDTSAASATDVILDIPTSPHAQRRDIIDDARGVRYPVTHVGPYAELPLPHLHVSSITELNVRDSGGDVTDWVAGSEVEGVGDDYYLQTMGQNSYGRTYLRIDTGTLPRLVDYNGVLTVSYDYGLDYATEAWDDINQAIAMLAAAEVMDDDDVITQIPDSGTLIGVETQHSNLVEAAMRTLRPYMSDMGDNR